MYKRQAGTVTPDVAKAVQEVKAGKIEYRLDKTNIIHCPIGKVLSLIHICLLEQVKVRFYPAAEYPGYSYLKIYERSASREAMLERLKQDLGMERSVVLTTQEGCGDVVIRGGANQAVKRLGRLFEPYLWEQK